MAHKSNLKFGDTPMHGRGGRHSGGLRVVDDGGKMVAKNARPQCALSLTNTEKCARGARVFHWGSGGAEERRLDSFSGLKMRALSARFRLLLGTF